MVIVDETGDKILLGVGALAFTTTPKPSYHSFRKTLRGGFIPHWPVSLNQEKHLKMRSGEKCGKKQESTSLTYNTTLRSLGLVLSSVNSYHRTEPVQPFPANLMVGFYARADSKQPIRTDLDKELAGM
jgi:hypothetical protein